MPASTRAGSGPSWLRADRLTPMMGPHQSGRATLLPNIEAWIRAAPGLRYPQALVMQCPRIANALGAVRHDPDAVRAQFDALSHDQRGGWRGFPLDALMDLLALREALVHDDLPPQDDDATRWVS